MISYVLPARLTHQKAFMQSKARGKALVTGYGGGKSYAHCHEAIKHSILDNGIPHMMVSPSFPVAKKTLVPAMHEILQDQYGLVSGKDYRFNKTDHEFFIHKWNGQIWIGAGERPDSLNGPNLGSFGIDEPGQQKKDVYTKMLARLRHPKARHLQYWLTGTPEGLNWFYDVCEGDNIPKDFELIRGKTTDNTHLPQSFIDDLYDQYDELLVDAYINGRFVNMTSGAAYHEYDEELNSIGSFDPDKSKPLLIGQDFNYDPMCTIVAQECRVNGKICVVVFDELFLHGADTDAAFEQLISKFGKDWRYEVYPDPACYSQTGHGAGKSDIDLIRNTFKRFEIHPGDGYWVNPAKKHPLRKDRLNSVNGLLCNSKKERRLLFTKNVKNIKNDMKKNTKEEFLNGKFKDPMQGHIGDALGYMVQKRYPIRVEKVRTYNYVV